MKIVANLIVIAVLAVFAYAIISILIRDSKNKKEKDELANNGVSTQAVITDVRSRSGGGGYMNITLAFRFSTDTGSEVNSKADAVINAMDTGKYQPGEKVNIRYLRSNPGRVLVDIPNPLLKKKKL
ncbi:DUF3592 domain-containing protein [Erwinia mallotivora]|uniref:DUF3592 domain-containing protein n=1 Tax=Erwinia mallotivora TaxID=69222 RepID=A0A014MH14_9GAMM|nr:DUF3592 domain-containing protein [Erwinia mallotivora]EXU77409.1 hypothetical protein BG55_22955 [Erwinia mallotivora]